MGKEDAPFIEEIFKRMMADNNQLAAIPYLFSLLHSSANEHQNQSSSITEFKKLVTVNVDRNYTIDQYAEKLGSSAEMLTQTCKAETGLTATNRPPLTNRQAEIG